MKKWYLARRLMTCSVAGRPSLIEEDFFLLRAFHQAEAKDKARQISIGEETSYDNCYGQQVTWAFQRVIDVSALDIEEFTDGVWIYRRSFPRLSKLTQRSRDRISLSDRASHSRPPERKWYGAMLFFRVDGEHPHEEERLLLVQAAREEDAAQRALKAALKSTHQSECVVGLFQMYEILEDRIETGTEVYCRFYRPSQLKRNPLQPPREARLSVLDVSQQTAEMRASA